MEKEFKEGDIVKSIKDEYGLGFNNGDTATFIKYYGRDTCFINTDKLNNFNHSDFNGNGLLIGTEEIELVSRTTIGKWTPSEVDTLHLMYKRYPITEIADKLNRKPSSVTDKAHREGLSKYNRTNFNAKDTHYLLHSYVDGISPSEMALNLHRTRPSIYNKLARMKKQGLLPQFTTGDN